MTTLRIGILSAARIAPPAIIAPAKEHPEVEVTAIAARDLERAQAFADEHGIGLAMSDYAQLCDSDAVDAIYIATPAALHREWTLAALRAGKHVLCEKPLAANEADARTIVDEARRTGLVMMEAFHWRYHPMAARIHELCARDIDTPRAARASFFVGHIPPSDIRHDLSLGGGALMDLGVYPIQWVRHVAHAAGFDENPSVRWATAVVSDVDPAIDIEMTGMVQFRKSSGDTFDAEVHCSMKPGVGFGATLHVTGDNDASLEVQNPLAPQLGNLVRVHKRGETREESMPTTPTYTYQLQAFADAVLRGAPYPTGGDDSLETMRLVDDLYRAAGMQPRPTHP